MLCVSLPRWDSETLQEGSDYGHSYPEDSPTVQYNRLKEKKKRKKTKQNKNKTKKKNGILEDFLKLKSEFQEKGECEESY